MLTGHFVCVDILLLLLNLLDLLIAGHITERCRLPIFSLFMISGLYTQNGTLSTLTAIFQVDLG